MPYSCTVCGESLPLHRARYRIDAGRLLAAYCQARCAGADGDTALESAVPQAPATWVALDEHDAPATPWSPPPQTLAERLAAVYGMPAMAAEVLALLAQEPSRLLHPSTLLAAARLPATSSGDRVTLSSLLVDAFSRASGDLDSRVQRAVAQLCEPAPPRELLTPEDRETACGWLAEQGVVLSDDAAVAELEILARASTEPDAWPLPSAGCRLAPRPPAGLCVRMATPTDEALLLLLAGLPEGAQLLRFAARARQGMPMEVRHARTLLAGDPPRPLPARVIPSVLQRLPHVLEHPSLRGRAPSVRTAVALLGGLECEQDHGDEEPEATQTLARLLAAPFVPPLQRRIELIAPTGSVGGPIRGAVGYDAHGSLTLKLAEIAKPLAWLVAAATDPGVYVLVSSCTVTLPDGALLSDAIGLFFDRDANELRLVVDLAQSCSIVELTTLRATRVEPLVGDGSGWIGRTTDGQLTRADGPAPPGPVLIDDAGRCVQLPGSRALEASLALACGIDADTPPCVVTQTTPLESAQLAWGPCALAYRDGAIVVAARADGEDLPNVRLLVDDAPVAEGSSWRVIGLEDGVALLGRAQDQVVGTHELPVSELPFRFRGTPQLGGELVALH